MFISLAGFGRSLEMLTSLRLLCVSYEVLSGVCNKVRSESPVQHEADGRGLLHGVLKSATKSTIAYNNCTAAVKLQFRLTNSLLSPHILIEKIMAIYLEYHPNIQREIKVYATQSEISSKAMHTIVFVVFSGVDTHLHL